MTKQAACYRSFLLRLWRHDQTPNAVWRSTLVETLTGEEHSFTELNDLVAFLQATGVRNQSTNHQPEKIDE